MNLSTPDTGKQGIEASLHCIMAVQEGIPLEDNPYLRRLFGPEILGCLPTIGAERIRRTAVVLTGLFNILSPGPSADFFSGTYASWFTTQPSSPPGPAYPSLLMNAISYVVAALTEPALCLPAANALRDLCDANRAALAPHISAFGELHANLSGIPVYDFLHY